MHQQFSCARAGGTADVTAGFEVNNCITVVFLSCPLVKKHAGLFGSYLY